MISNLNNNVNPQFKALTINAPKGMFTAEQLKIAQEKYRSFAKPRDSINFVFKDSNGNFSVQEKHNLYGSSWGRPLSLINEYDSSRQKFYANNPFDYLMKKMEGLEKRRKDMIWTA